MGRPDFDDNLYAADWRATCPNPACGRHITPSDVECPNCKGRGSIRFYRSWDWGGSPGSLGGLNYGLKCDNCGIAQSPLPCPSECGSVVTSRFIVAYMKLSREDESAIICGLATRHSPKNTPPENALIAYRLSITLFVPMVLGMIIGTCLFFYLWVNGYWKHTGAEGPLGVSVFVCVIIALVGSSLVDNAYKEYEANAVRRYVYKPAWAWVTYKP